jgi:hypothetical protein
VGLLRAFVVFEGSLVYLSLDFLHLRHLEVAFVAPAVVKIAKDSS